MPLFLKCFSSIGSFQEIHWYCSYYLVQLCGKYFLSYNFCLPQMFWSHQAVRLLQSAAQWPPTPEKLWSCEYRWGWTLGTCLLRISSADGSYFVSWFIFCGRNKGKIVCYWGFSFVHDLNRLHRILRRSWESLRQIYSLLVICINMLTVNLKPYTLKTYLMKWDLILCVQVKFPVLLAKLLSLCALFDIFIIRNPNERHWWNTRRKEEEEMILFIFSVFCCISNSSKAEIRIPTEALKSVPSSLVPR